MIKEGEFHTSDWLNQVAVEAKATVFGRLDKDSAVAVASAVLIEMGSYDTGTPWAVVFSFEDINDVAGKLLNVLKTSDNCTPYFILRLQRPIHEVKSILTEAGLLHSFADRRTASHLVTVVAGQPGAEFILYRDKARKLPGYASEWLTYLKAQFGEELASDALGKNDELLHILDRTQRAAKVLGQRQHLYANAAYKIRGLYKINN